MAVPEDRCQFSTTTPEGAMRQSARGGRTRYKRCRNRAGHTITITDPTLADPGRTRPVRCCGLHKKLHEERGFMP